MSFRTRLPAVVLCALFALPVAVLADNALPRDPNNTYGEFSNGFKYIIRPHDIPADRVVFYLHVKTGALNETDQQNGLAHFLEHMAFNGSEHFAPGELIPFMNKMGMQFGAHSNAHTSFKETVYKLTMPDNKQETIDTALTIFADWAHGLLLTKEEIDKERKVILEESRRSKSAAKRIQDMWREQVLAGTRIAIHDVIGDEELIATFPRKEFVDYWNTWYRPENMTLIAVGEIDTAKIITQAKGLFGNFKARAKQREFLGAQIKPINKARAFIFTDPEQVRGRVEITAITKARPPIKTYEQYRFNELENIGTWVVSRRLQEMVNKGTASFLGAGVFVHSFENEAILQMGSATGEPEDWNKMLDQVIVEIDRAVEHGFTQRELELAKKDLLAGAERAVEVEPTLDATRLVRRISRAIGAEEPSLSAKQHLDLMKKILKDVSLSEVHQVFVENFKRTNYNYILTMPEEEQGLKLPSKTDVLAAASAAWAKKTSPIKEEKAVDGILAALPKPGKVASQTTDPDLKITTATLSNGVTVHHRFMDYKKDQVFVNITFAAGVIEETAANRGVSQVADLVGATSRLSSTQIRDLMTGKKINVRSRIGLDTASISISGSPEDLETGFQLAYAFATDGKIEQSAFDNWKTRTLQRLEQLKTMPQGHLQEAMEQVFKGGDIRLSRLTPELVAKQTIARGEAWVKHITASAPIEAAIVGDISLEDAMALATRYLGSLPQRSIGYEGLDSLRKIKRGPGPFKKTVHFDSITPKAIAMAGFVGAELRDIMDHRKLVLSASIISVRMIKRLREDEGLVYGIGASHRPARAIPGLGMMSAASTTDPENAEKLASTIIEMFRDFADKGPTAEELDIARLQMANRLDTQMKEPSFWLGQISQMKYRKRPIEDLKLLPDVYQTFSAKQLQNVVKKYMKDDKIIRFVAIPNTTDAEAKQKEKALVPAKGY